MKRFYYVYILASFHRTLYIGVTSNLEQRLIQHRWSTDPQRFTTRYNVHRLVYYEEYSEITQAISREKQLKGWKRSRKLDLIATMNADFNDLAPDLYPPQPSVKRSFPLPD